MSAAWRLAARASRRFAAQRVEAVARALLVDHAADRAPPEAPRPPRHWPVAALQRRAGGATAADGDISRHGGGSGRQGGPGDAHDRARGETPRPSTRKQLGPSLGSGPLYLCPLDGAAEASSPASAHPVLNLTKGWIPPLCRIERRIFSAALAEHERRRRSALHHGRDLAQRRGLPGRAQHPEHHDVVHLVAVAMPVPRARPRGGSRRARARAASGRCGCSSRRSGARARASRSRAPPPAPWTRALAPLPQ